MQMEARESMMDDQEINLLDLFIVMLKRKRFIFLVTLAVAVAAVVVSLVMAPVYQATTKILPPKESGSTAGQLLSQLEGVGGFLLGSSGTGAQSSALYIGLLQTEPILDPIIERFELMKRYEMESQENARKALGGALTAEADKESGIILVSVMDKDPQLAAELANAFVEELKNLLKRLAVTEASQRRLFFEEQLKDAHMALMEAEESMQGFQETTGAIQIEEQAKAVLEGISALRAQVAAKEVQLKVMKTYASANNPDVKMVTEELAGLREQLKKLEVSDGSRFPDTIIPTGDMPTLGTEYIRKLRQFKYQETLYELLVKQYEAARLDEARDSALIQIIHKASPPERRAKPKRTLIVVLATAVGFFLSIFAAFLLEFISKTSEDPENRERIEELKRHMKKL